MTQTFAGGVEAASGGGIREEGGRKIKEEQMGNIGKEKGLSWSKSREGTKNNARPQTSTNKNVASLPVCALSDRNARFSFLTPPPYSQLRVQHPIPPPS
jgi:hypothetical protein